VVAALGADVEVALELGAVQHRVTGWTFYPQPFRNRTRAPFGLDARRDYLLEPGHQCAIIAESSAGNPKAPGYSTRQKYSPRAAAVASPALRRRESSCSRARSGPARPSPIASSNPTMLRTMWCRKALAVTSMRIQSSRRSTVSARSCRTGERAWH